MNSSTTQTKMTTLVDIANKMLRELGYKELTTEKKKELASSALAEMMLGGTKQGNSRTLPPLTEEGEEMLHTAILAQKANSFVDKGGAMKVLLDVDPETGKVELVMPMGVAPDTAGYNRNKAFQKERRTKMTARLRRKLAEKHDAHTGEECDRCFWEK